MTRISVTRVIRFITMLCCVGLVTTSCGGSGESISLTGPVGVATQSPGVVAQQRRRSSGFQWILRCQPTRFVLSPLPTQVSLRALAS